MAQLGQLDLQLTFMRAGALGKNIQDETSTVNDSAFAQALQITFLRRG